MKQGTSSRSLMVSALGAAIVTVVPMRLELVDADLAPELTVFAKV